MEEIIIEKLKNKDALSVQKFTKECISKIQYYSLPAKKKESERFSKENILKALKDKLNLFLVAKMRDNIVGFICGRFDCGTFLGDWIFVHEKLRNRGLASNLMNYLENYLKNRVHKIWCDSRTNNKEVIRVLLRHNFQKIAELKNHWYRQDFYLWEKSIGSYL